MYQKQGETFSRIINKLWLALLSLVTWEIAIQSQTTPSYGQRLGWGADDVVVILHVDDVGMSHSANVGAIQSVENGVATSWAVMMPCAWVSEIAHYLHEHPTVDSGLHLTLTSEWKSYRWGPIAGKSAVPGLVDNEGCLWRSVPQVLAKASADEIELEIRAQVNRAETLGIPITHLDSHMGTLFAHPDYFRRYAKVGIEKQIPILAPGGHMTYAAQENGEAAEKLKPFVQQIWDAGLPVIDDLHTDSYGWPADEKPERLATLLKALKPGITEILFHASEPSDVFPLITGSSESRKGDLNALTSPMVRETIIDQKIILTTWKELMERRRKVQP
ncbi:MAG: ChbG/HpnK family deacetylase [Verrucomicrobia bacterium]|nr:ChbG/HpnK family deacetylase [Verrucomicrobiota bacterium]